VISVGVTAPVLQSAIVVIALICAVIEGGLTGAPVEELVKIFVGLVTDVAGTKVG
jgi:hypothetical protein